MRKRLAADGVALTERLCVYPRYIDPEWVAQGVLDVDQDASTGSSSRAAAPGAREAPRPIRRDLVAGAIAKGARRRAR